MRLFICTLIIVLGFSGTTCKPEEAPSNNARLAAESDPNFIIKYLSNFVFQIVDFKKVCEFSEETKAALEPRSPLNTCIEGGVENICKTGILPSAGKFVGDLVSNENDQQIQQDLTVNKIAFVKQALTGCFKKSGESELLRLSAKFADRLGIRVLEKAASTDRTLKRALAEWACTGGAKAIGDAINSQNEVDYQNACSLNRSEAANKSQVASCFRTAGSICQIAVDRGGINVDNFLPNDAGVARQISQNLASEVASGACKLGAATTQTACGVINAAAEQIKQSILTGNNDWATCVGTAQIGACIGSRIGSGGWTNNNGVEKARTGTDSQTGRDFDYKGCCLCRLDKYEEGFIYNTMLSSYDVISVIQAGDFNSGSCRYRENKGYFKSGDPKFSYRYQNCRKKYVAGQACRPNSRGQARVWQGSKIGYRTLFVRSF